MFIDTHCHFEFKEFDQDRDQIWQECVNQGVDHLIIPAVSPDGCERITTLCGRNAEFKFAAGLHPWWIDKENLDVEALSATILPYLKNSECVAVGECGLDALISTSLDKQINFFEVQIKLAIEVEKPLIIHCVKAHNELIELLKKHKPCVDGVIHGFSGSFEQASTYWDMGFSIGVGGTITYSRAKKTRDAIARLPLEALVLETDSPAMPLAGQQGKRNSPLQVVNVAKALAELRNLPLEEIGYMTSDNARRVFNL